MASSVADVQLWAPSYSIPLPRVEGTRIRRSEGRERFRSLPVSPVQRVQRNFDAGVRQQSGNVLRRELDDDLRAGLTRQRGASRGIDERSAARDVDRSAGHRPAPSVPVDPAEAAAKQEATARSAAERLEREARFDDPANVATRAKREEADRGEEARGQEKLASKAGWEATASKQIADRRAVMERRDGLLLEGLDDALMLNFPELREADARLARAVDALDIAGAQAAIAEVEQLFHQLGDLLDKVAEVEGEFTAIGEVGQKKQKTKKTIEENLQQKSVKPWKEFRDNILPLVVEGVGSLAETKKRREAQAGDRDAAERAKQTAADFIAHPTAAKLQEQLTAALIRRGEVTRSYKSSWDSLPGEFSVEVTVMPLREIVIHAHCEPDGTPKPGNGTHWKYFSERTQAGKSHHLTDELIDGLVDKVAAKKHRDGNKAINTQ